MILQLTWSTKESRMARWKVAARAADFNEEYSFLSSATCYPTVHSVSTPRNLQDAPSPVPPNFSADDRDRNT